MTEEDHRMAVEWWDRVRMVLWQEQRCRQPPQHPQPMAMATTIISILDNQRQGGKCIQTCMPIS
jgi:hypothetical protein